MSRGGVNARAYVTHLMTMGRFTVCGRPIVAVNCQPISEPISASTCKMCARRARS